MDTNVISVVGRLGKDPETRLMQNGTAVCNFSVAVNDYRKNEDGGYEKNTTWIDVTAWAKLAERLSENLKKGTQASVVGAWRNNTWEDNEGKKRVKSYILAREVSFDFLPKTDEAGGDGNAKPSQGEQKAPEDAKAPAENKSAPDDEEDSLPF
jgi:single-strand DNA-binding protein